MKKYESVILVNSKLNMEERTRVVSKMEDFIKQNGILESTEDLGVKKLAYQIKDNVEANYYIFKFETEAENITELERLYRITDEIIKFIVVIRN